MPLIILLEEHVLWLPIIAFQTSIVNLLQSITIVLLLLAAVLTPAINVAQLKDPVLRTDTSTTIIPFTRAGNLILIKAKADTAEGSFIFDTGTPGLVLNNTYFREYAATPMGGEQRSINGIGGEAMKTVVRRFTMGAFSYHFAEAELLGLGHLEESKGVRILGLIGVSLFKQCELMIDYERNEIHLHHIRRKERKTYQHAILADTAAYLTYPIEIRDNRILIKTTIADRDLRFVVDYAAETNIVDGRLPDKILDSIEISGRVMLAGTGTRKVEALAGALSNLTVGELQISDLPVIITNLENTCFGGVNCINGVLGYDFLSRYKLVFNFIKRKLYILK